MSTRRARIKAITSLPVRRKAAEVVDTTKNKEVIKEKVEQVTKSPRTPRGLPKNIDEVERKSPVIKNTSPVTQCSEKTSVISCTTPKESHPYEVKVSIVESPSRESTPTRVEKIPVITPNVNFKRNTSCSSPRNHDFASPLAPSPKLQKTTGSIVQGSSTPLKLKTPSAHTVDINNELQITTKNVNSVVYNSVSSKSAVSDDYNVPSVPESVETDGVMDGIVPLQAESNVPKPIDLLKNEIISENAEVLFDPIIPLPSPSKVRPKLRPTPRLGPHRRNSVQGSASESEDESRRALLGGTSTPGVGRQRHDSQSTLCSAPNRNRTRNDSVCSSVSQAMGQASASPSRDKSSSKIRRREASRRMAAMRRKREAIQRENLTMYDLIFYNPTSNPMPPNIDEIKAKEETKKEEEEKVKKETEEKEKKEVAKIEESPKDVAPVPQITLGPNGEIVLDKSSLVINRTDAKRELTSTVREGSWGTGSGKYTKAQRTADWSASETVRFYRALAALGTDFSLMAQLFPDRNRRELKLKFKKEERLNGALVDKALRAGNDWDPNQLQKEFQDERAEAAKKAIRDAEKLKKALQEEKERSKTSRERRVRISKASKALQTTMLPGISKQQDDITTADDLVQRALNRKKKKQPINEDTAPVEVPPPPTSMATLTLINNAQKVQGQSKAYDNMATLSRISPARSSSPVNLNSMPNVPSNIETGSLVVLTVNDPSSPSKKMLQTYIAHSAGRLTPVALPPTFLNSVVGYMKKGTPKSTVSSSSSPLMSPSSVTSQDSRTSVATPAHLNSSPVKRKRMSSYTITPI